MRFLELIRRLRGKRGVGQPVPTEILPGERVGPAEIEPLICPLRYDLKVRIDLCRLWLNEGGFELDRPGFWEGVPALEAYYVWFREVEVRRFRRDLAGDDSRVRGEFPSRVRRALTLWESLAATGLDADARIRLRTGERIRSVNGKCLGARFFPADGCHRIAWVYARGARQLEPDQFIVERFQDFLPLDNTRLLLRTLPLSQEQYCAFLSAYYCQGKTVDSPLEILREVDASTPEKLREVLSVLEADYPGATSEWKRS